MLEARKGRVLEPLLGEVAAGVVVARLVLGDGLDVGLVLLGESGLLGCASGLASGCVTASGFAAGVAAAVIVMVVCATGGQREGCI